MLALYLTLAPYGGNLEGVRAASLAYFGKEPKRLSLARGGAAGRAAAIAGAAPAGPLARWRRERRATACSTASPRPDRFRADEIALRQARSVPAGGGRCRCWRRMPPIRRSRRRRTQKRPSADHRRRACRRAWKTSRASGRAALGPDLSVAIMAVDNATGEVLARVASSDYFDEQPRRPGRHDAKRCARPARR